MKVHWETKEELCKVKSDLERQARELKDMETLANAAMHDYDMLKTAKMLEIGDNDIATTKRRVSKLIRDVDRCITLLTGQQTSSQK